MQDINNLYYFSKVVEYGGFAAAGRALGLPKSTLSRRIAQLEDSLGVRLIQRSTRHFTVTEIGRAYYRHCAAVVDEVQAAQDAIDRTRARPQGLVRITCPVALLQNQVGEIATRFLADHPLVDLSIEATNRRVDVIEEGVDVALRVRPPPLENTDLVIRVLEEHKLTLVGSPVFLARQEHPRTPADLGSLDSLDMSRTGGDHVWDLRAADGRRQILPHRPRLITDDMITLRRAALAGLGIVQLPAHMVMDDLAKGDLELVLPDWSLPGGLAHAVFASRRGLMPAVRAFLDYLADSFGAASS